MGKEIGIEKLIRYLLESKGEEYKEEYYEWYRDVELQNIDSLSELKPFIKWLVENDKIDLYKIPEIKLANPDYIYGKTDIVLMYLAISDTPIDDLISYLK